MAKRKIGFCVKRFNMEQSLISVIIPCYKVEKYLPKCIESILEQTYENLEIWLVDDGSPDNCGKICDEYAQKDERIKVIHKENGGLSDARNVAIGQATGEWITFVDSDDYVAATYVEELYSLVIKYNCEVGIALFCPFKEGGTPNLSKIKVVEEKMSPAYAVEQMFYQKRFDTCAWSKLYHRSLFEKGIRYPKGLLFEDLLTTYLLIFNSNGVAFKSKQLYYYLLRPSSIVGAYSPKKVQSALALIDMMDSNKELLKCVEKAYRCRMLSFCFHILLSMPINEKAADSLWMYIKKVRKCVLLDNKARMKARIAALVSYSGLRVARYFFTFVNKRS